MKLNLIMSFLLVSAGMLFMAFVLTPTQTEPWPVPENYVKMKNPVTFDKAAAASLYSTHCKSCHGKEGLGDGTKAAQLDTDCGDFSSAEFQKQTDGSLFYKTLEGRDEMPGFKKKIPDEDDIWQLVHFMRTLEE